MNMAHAGYSLPPDCNFLITMIPIIAAAHITIAIMISNFIS